MDEYFNHRQYCIKAENISQHEKIYCFKFPNGQTVEISRDMKCFKEWFGYWKVYIISDEGIRVSSFYGHRSAKGIERFLGWVKNINV
ncbi:MAG: hypothetical protein IJE68_04630 [Clostridia bacterium]|nr:hypothetical protein [Clostridia bacterium]